MYALGGCARVYPAHSPRLRFISADRTRPPLFSRLDDNANANCIGSRLRERVARGIMHTHSAHSDYNALLSQADAGSSISFARPRDLPDRLSSITVKVETRRGTPNRARAITLLYIHITEKYNKIYSGLLSASLLPSSPMFTWFHSFGQIEFVGIQFLSH